MACSSKPRFRNIYSCFPYVNSTTGFTDIVVELLLKSTNNEYQSAYFPNDITIETLSIAKKY